MLDRSSRIKNLSDALVGISCIHMASYSTAFEEITQLLDYEIQRYKEEQQEAYPAPSPIKPSLSTDDEIPF